MTSTRRPGMGRWLEELAPGLVIDHAITRTITESDNTMFTVMTMNPAAITSTARSPRAPSSGDRS